MTRATYYLNIGTDVSGSHDVDGSQEISTVRALADLSGLGGSYNYTVSLGAPYLTTDGRQVQETTIVAVVHTSHDLAAWTEAVYRASVQLRQDCISWSPDNGNTGSLTGPSADQYGDFNPAYFVPYAA